MTTANAYKPDADVTPSGQSPMSPMKNEASQKSPVESVSQGTDANLSDRLSDTDGKKSHKIREHDDRKIFVGNLPVDTDEAQLVEHFNQAGKVEYTTIIKARDGTPRRYGFVVFNTKEDSIKAVESLNNVEFNDSTLVVQAIDPRTRRWTPRRSYRRYSSRRGPPRRGRSLDAGDNLRNESRTNENAESSQRNFSRPYGRRQYNDYQGSRRRFGRTQYSSPSRQDEDDGFANSQATQTQDSQGEGHMENRRSDDYYRRQSSFRRSKRPYLRRSRGEDSGFLHSNASSSISQGEDYNVERVASREEEPRGRRGRYDSSSQDFGYPKNEPRRIRRSEDRGQFRSNRRNGPPTSEYRRRSPRSHFRNQPYNSERNFHVEDNLSKTAVFIGNLAYKVHSDELADFFTEKGYSVHDAYIVRDENERSRGYGFVEFESHEDQLKAIDRFDGFDFFDRTIAIKPAVMSPRTSAESYNQHHPEK
ncbi:hypothetical protein HMI54_007576 [Coelomomyces lativittatus]|nr:hypothetical protein HMI54_007576 [Coelomomyces lativittatus]